MTIAAILRCATILALAFGVGQASAQTPIAGARNWLLFDRLPGVDHRVCTARANGPEADTMLMLNDNRVPILAAGRADWRELLGPAEVELSIDGAPPTRLTAQMFNNLVLVLLSDAALRERLRAARTHDWTFPFGRYRAEVTGLGTALDAIAACGAAPEPRSAA